MLTDKLTTLTEHLEKDFGRKPDINGILYLIGVQEYGQGLQAYSKEMKTDLINLGAAVVWQGAGYLKQKPVKREGWPEYESLKPIPDTGSAQYKEELTQGIINYFKDIYHL